eukprot:1531513-Pleurochrysis_carterae.AAC.2
MFWWLCASGEQEFLDGLVDAEFAREEHEGYGAVVDARHGKFIEEPFLRDHSQKSASDAERDVQPGRANSRTRLAKVVEGRPAGPEGLACNRALST